MSEERTNEQKNSNSNTMIPYIIAVAGSALVIIADFITYLTATGFFYTRKLSLFKMITECINDPAGNLGTTEDKILFGVILAGVIASVLALLFILLKKMKAGILFAVIACLPFLLMGDAWLHYAGSVLAVVGAVWFLIAGKKSRYKSLQG